MVGTSVEDRCSVTHCSAEDHCSAKYSADDSAVRYCLDLDRHVLGVPDVFDLFGHPNRIGRPRRHPSATMKDVLPAFPLQPV